MEDDRNQERIHGDENVPEDQGQGNDGDEASPFLDHHWVGHTLFLARDRPTFARQAAALNNPAYAYVVNSIRNFHVPPSCADQESAEHVATFLGTRTTAISSLVMEDSTFDSERAEMNRRFIDMWLDAVARNDALHLHGLGFRGQAASLKAFREFAKSNKRNWELSFTARSEHVRGLSEYLDPDLKVPRLDVSVVSNDELGPVLDELRRVLPSATALQELDFSSPLRSDPEVDISAVFLAPSVHKLTLSQGALHTIPTSCSVRKLSLCLTTLSTNAIVALNSLPSLESLILSGGDLFADGSVETLPPNTTIRDLKVVRSTLSASALHWLRSLTSLESLHLFQCKMQPGQTFLLQPLLQANVATLRSMDLQQNTFGPAGTPWWQGLVPFLYQSRAMRRLHIRGTPLPGRVLNDLRRHLVSNECRLVCLGLPIDLVNLEFGEVIDILEDVTRSQSLDHFFIGSVASREHSDYLVAAMAADECLRAAPTLAWEYPCKQYAHLRGWNTRHWCERVRWRAERLPHNLWPSLATGLSNTRHNCPYCDMELERDADATSLLYSSLRAAPDVI